MIFSTESTYCVECRNYYTLDCLLCKVKNISINHLLYSNTRNMC